MEILLIACMLAYVAGAQSEQSKLGVSPAQRDQMREQTRHQKAVQKIADKHAGAKTPAPSNGSVSPWKDRHEGSGDDDRPATFMSGYRDQRPSRPPLGRRVGERAGKGVTWGQNTGRDAWRSYRERRKREGREGPELVMVPHPPQYPPAVPPQPATPPTVDGAPAKPNAPPGGAVPEPATKGVDDVDKKTSAKPVETVAEKPDPTTAKPETPATAPDKTVTGPESEAPKTDLSKPADPGGSDRPPDANPQPADTPQGVGRMAAEVTYDSVMDESDELSAMCDDDLHTYDRIKKRAEREIGRGDTLAAQVLSTGFGATIHAIVVRCREQYQIIHDAIDDLKANTVAQAEAVVTAKDLLLKGQGVYADIAKDMEDVASRDAYISDAVDAEDVNPEAEVYETKAVA